MQTANNILRIINFTLRLYRTKLNLVHDNYVCKNIPVHYYERKYEYFKQYINLLQ